MMVDVNGFKHWLDENKDYSKAVVSDIASRVKRADKLLEWSNEDVYQFRLEQLDGYKSISVSVRSQIKKAVKLYSEYVKYTQKDNVELEK